MKERIYRSLPFVLVILGAFGILITNELWLALVSLAGVWLLPSPVSVSRETLPVSVSRETLSVPCAFIHGSAEPHVQGCEGWTSDPI